MSKEINRRESGKSPTASASHTERRAQDARCTSGRRLEFHHPVVVLRSRVRDAWQWASGLDELSFHLRDDQLRFLEQ